VKGQGQNPPLVDQFDLSTPVATNGPHAWLTAVWPRPGGPQPIPGNDYVLRFTAHDTAGNTGFQSETLVSWLGGAHSAVEATSPADDATVSGADVAIVAAPDANGHEPQYAALNVDEGGGYPNQTWYVGESGVPPWAIPNDTDGGWDTTKFGNGPHVVWATLYTAEPLPASSAGTLVNVDNGDPAITVTGIAAGDHVTGSVALHATLTGIPAGWDDPYRVEFYANGRKVIDDNTPGAGIGGTWNTGAYDDGRVEIRAVARFFGLGIAEWSLWSQPVVVTVQH
jgi:hypothetical protein